MKKKHYIVTAVASYFIFLIATIPAQSITNLISNDSIKIQDVSGTIWNGEAYVISVDGTTLFKNAHWSFTLWRLFIGQIAADIHARYLDDDIDAQIGASIFGGYFVNDLSTKISASNAAQLANIPLAQLTGLISVNIEHARWEQGEMPLITGTINWNNATVTVADTVSLGNVTITMSESEQQLLFADINNKDGDIAITGTARLVAEANYAIDIMLTPSPSASSNITQSLGLFAKKKTNGSYHFKKSGPLNQIGLM